MSGRLQRLPAISLAVVLLFTVLAALSWVNYGYAQEHPGGVDFMTHWVAARAVLRGVSPYSPEAATEVQMLFYGHPASPGDNEFLVVYPIYYIIMYLPFGLIADYILARTAWLTVAEILLVVIALLSAQAVDWKLSPRFMPLYLVFSLFWYQGLRAVINGNIVVFVTFWLVVALAALQKRRDMFAGVALVIATAKPNLALLPVLWVGIWAVYTRRWNVLKGFLGSLILFVLVGTAVFPQWLIQLPQLMMRYPSYNPPTSPAMVFNLWLPGIGLGLGFALALIAASILLWAWWRFRLSDYPVFLWVYCLTLVISQWIGITTDPGNFLILFLPLALILARLQHSAGIHWVIVALVTLFIGLWALFLATYTIDAAGQSMQSPLLFFPLPMLLLAGLFFFGREQIKSGF